ncbi:ADR064Cp [Eremothecium gossypii ATCC 10895]|uniref:AP-1 complex subunit gamma n=1 Tax=Eremothecium gossypii (strain ATCC 10895 / CBS 109.51 / FGSC 9923 / NRRL Y-1056) TaxID=284811 RepID=Q75A55_EREGS|nr:ADR064Cp [Eremothecium gossypii ATCC 10895]AAS51984.2 ADR064Cp [Eremothecium gossypii ATCC 10895]
MGSLRTFIKDVRSAKTLADERSIITKESAKIRTKLKDDHLSLSKRRKNIHKLLYLYVLGEKTHFAQVECINLIASDDFENKRLGYLAAMLLLDEKQELLTLLTNVLNSDLCHPTKYVVSLALCALGTLASVELARDLHPDVERILQTSQDPYLFKKALQCAAKMVARDSFLASIFYPYVRRALSHELSTHGVLFGALQLLQSIMAVEDLSDIDDQNKIVDAVAGAVPDLLSKLQLLNTPSFTPEYDAVGVADPFLQVELLYTLRRIFEKVPDNVSRYSGKLVSVLSSLCSHAEQSKNGTNAILYEAVRTIFALKLEHKLRIQAIDILAIFLTSKDINNKYVALNMLTQVVSTEPQAVQTRRKFISKCLFDPDASIRRRALELTFAIIEDSNMKDTVEELVAFLTSSDGEDRDLIVYTVEHLLNIFGMREVADERWKLTVLIRILKVIGQHMTVEIISEILVMLNNISDVATKKEIGLQLVQFSLDKEQNNISEDNIGWKLIIVWVIGEYAELMLGEPGVTDISLTNYLSSLNSFYSDDHKLIGYILTAALKLSLKIHDPACFERLRQLIKSHDRDTDLILQTKAVHYGILFSQPANIKKAFLEPMPLIVTTIRNSGPSATNATRKPSLPDPIGDLLSDIPQTQSLPAVAVKSVNTKQGDLLTDIFKSSSPPPVQKVPTPTATVTVPAGATEMHHSNLVQVFGSVVSSANGKAEVELFFKAKSRITQLHVLVAVAKTQQLTLGALTNTNMNPGDITCQSLQVVGTGALKLRVKLEASGGVTEQFDHKFNAIL